jgi:hypothetical protein
MDTNKQLKDLLDQLNLSGYFSFSDFVEHVQIYTRTFHNSKASV